MKVNIATGDLRSGIRAFTLLEVLIASVIFFAAVFLILDVVGSSLRTAHSLQHHTLDAGIIAAQLSLTNIVTEGPDSGDFGDLYPEYKWTTDTFEVGTNGLYEVDIAIFRRDGAHAMEIGFERPDV